MLETVKRDVCDANLALVKAGLVFLTWGNASAIDRATGLVVIKPSGVSYDTMKPDDMTVVDMQGAVVEGRYKPSVDTPTHLRLYQAFPGIGGIVHTHSHYATCWAQAGRAIPCLGTTHADYFYGDVPLADPLTQEEVATEYEAHIGEVIVRCYKNLDPIHHPAVLAANHGPFCWGNTVAKAVENAVVLEEVAKMAWHTLSLSPDQASLPSYLLDKHFLRKHGAGAYYGQK